MDLKLNSASREALKLLCEGGEINMCGLVKQARKLLEYHNLLQRRMVSRSPMIRAADPLKFRRCVAVMFNDFSLSDLPSPKSRAFQAALTGDSKAFSKVRSCPGFPVSVLQPMGFAIHGKRHTLAPPAGTFMYVSDYQSFRVDPGVTVVAVENMENFRCLKEQKPLFDDYFGKGAKLLFVSRFPLSRDLRDWLAAIPNRFYYYGDFDLAGVSIFESEYRRFLGSRAKMLIPKDIEERIVRHGCTERYLTQAKSLGKLQSGDPDCADLLNLICARHSCYDQEGYISNYPLMV